MVFEESEAPYSMFPPWWRERRRRCCCFCWKLPFLRRFHRFSRLWDNFLNAGPNLLLEAPKRLKNRGLCGGRELMSSTGSRAFLRMNSLFAGRISARDCFYFDWERSGCWMLFISKNCNKNANTLWRGPCPALIDIHHRLSPLKHGQVVITFF